MDSVKMISENKQWLLVSIHLVLACENDQGEVSDHCDVICHN